MESVRTLIVYCSFQIDHGDGVDSVSLTLHLEYCISRLYPDFAKYFSVTVEGRGIDEDGRKDNEKKGNTLVKSKEDTSSQQSSTLGLPIISIHYEVKSCTPVFIVSCHYILYLLHVCMLCTLVIVSVC